MGEEIDLAGLMRDWSDTVLQLLEKSAEQERAREQWLSTTLRLAEACGRLEQALHRTLYDGEPLDGEAILACTESLTAIAAFGERLRAWREAERAPGPEDRETERSHRPNRTRIRL
jgi:hypothetical protein